MAQTILSPSFVRGACVLQNPKIPSSSRGSPRIQSLRGQTLVFRASLPFRSLSDEFSVLMTEYEYTLFQTTCSVCASRLSSFPLILQEPDVPGLSLSEGMARVARAPLLLDFVLE